MLRTKPALSIVATILAKNEEDIIATNLEHHIEQGVSAFIITDNHSEDHTKEIVSKYSEVKELIEEPGENHHQSEWVTRMAKIACKFNPDWVVHLDADELWCGLPNLRKMRSEVVACERMYLHPPTGEDFSVQSMRWYLDLNHAGLPQECKVAHRPNPSFVIEHGNHAVQGVQGEHTVEVYRHHYPIRSYGQWSRKASGHLALMKRNSMCERWKNWYTLLNSGQLQGKFDMLTALWLELVQGSEDLNHFLDMLDFWATPEVTEYCRQNRIMPKIGEWPHA